MIPTTDTLQIDTLSLVPGTVQVIPYFRGQLMNPSACPYKILYPESKLILQKAPYPDSIIIQYRVLSVYLPEMYFHKDPEKLEQADLNLTPYEIKTTGSTNPLDAIEGLQYNGSLVRGLSFGNNQDVVLNSSFNLQMNGLLQNEVEISAAITDNNIPIQPEGNTQQLQEFDKVFIQLRKGGQTLLAGDFDMLRPQDYFMNYYKRSQGILYNGQFVGKAGQQWKHQLGTAVARGQYTRQVLAVVEGNQGPYKLRGNNGELFIIILAGTERIWLDGILLTRGAENDYIIDYNAGEITFTPRIAINKDKRIQVEFEYSDRSYFRSIITNQHSYQSADSNLTIRVHAYSEQDSKNQPLDQTLDSTSRQVLMMAGDSIQNAFISGADTLSYNPDRIMYRITDTLGFDSVFVYSTDPELAAYVLSFTELGPKKGNYVQSATLANGRVYTWVAPIGGIPQGNAEPVILLKAPVSRQMITTALDYKVSENSQLGFEVAYSKNDLNTFSETGNNDNHGLGIQLYHQAKKELPKNITTTTSLHYEHITRNFTFIERYRPIEFNRDWNFSSIQSAGEHLGEANVQLEKKELWTLQLQSATFIKEQQYTGFKQQAWFNFNNTKWRTKTGGSFVKAQTDSIETKFLRPDISFSRQFNTPNGLESGIRYWSEHQLNEIGDSLTSGSFYFDELIWFTQTADTAIQSFKSNIILRYDGLPQNGVFKRVNEGITMHVEGARQLESNRLSWMLTYRQLEVLDTTLSLFPSDNSLLGRFQHSFVAPKPWLQSDFFYELGTGQEPKREFTYVEVEPGQGTHSWIDYNEDGLQQLNEFEIAAFSDQATFVQVFIPTDEYIQANTSQLNYSLSLQPRVLWNEQKGLKAILTRFSSLSTWQIQQKIIDNGSLLSYTPIPPEADSNLVSSFINWQNTLYFNRMNPTFGAEINVLQNTGRQVLVNGIETRSRREQRILLRYKLSEPIVFNMMASSGERSLLSEAFTDRSYVTPFHQIEPKFIYIQGSIFRISLAYSYKNSLNTEGLEALSSHSGILDSRYNVPGKSSISSRISYSKVSFDGVSDSPVGFAMLEGLQEGNNILWNLMFDKRLSEILQVTLSYDGRKTGTADIVHVGRVQFRAIF